MVLVEVFPTAVDIFIMYLFILNIRNSVLNSLKFVSNLNGSQVGQSGCLDKNQVAEKKLKLLFFSKHLLSQNTVAMLNSKIASNTRCVLISIELLKAT